MLGWRGIFPVCFAGWRSAGQSECTPATAQLEERLDDDRLVLNEGHFFDKWGRRMKVEEVEP